MKVLALAGSLDGQSQSLMAARAALAGAAAAGAETLLLDIAELALPMFSVGGPTPPAAQRLADETAEADGLIWASPLYHGTVSGAFKNAVDWLELLAGRQPAYLTDKVVGLICTAGGAQAMQAINTMDFIVRALRGWVIPLGVPIARARHVFAPDGAVIDSAVAEQLRALGEEVARAAARFSSSPMTTPAAASAEAAVMPLNRREEDGAA